MNTLILYFFTYTFIATGNLAIASEKKKERKKKPQHRLLLGNVSSTCQQMKMTSTVSTNRMEPIFKGHTTNKQKKCLTSAWIRTFFKHPTFTVKKCESILTHILIYNYWNWQRFVSPLDPHPLLTGCCARE